MMCAQVPGGDKAYIVTSDLWSRFEPFKNIVCDGVGDSVGLTFWCLGAQCSGSDAFVKFLVIKRLGCSLSLTLDYNGGYVLHYKPPDTLLTTMVT